MATMTQDDQLCALKAVCILLLLWKLADCNLYHSLYLALEYVFTAVPTLDLPLRNAERSDDGVDSKPLKDSRDAQLRDSAKPGFIQCYDPSTMQWLGQVRCMDDRDVDAAVRKAAKAQKTWSKTSFRQRRKVLRTMQKYIVNHVEDICRVATRDSGKPKVDALLGEVLTTCEKIRCINANGELWLRKSYRPTGPMMMHKTAYVEYVPYGVLGVIAPWNYPFHNMMNHVISGLFSGNAVVGKVSEFTSWSADYFGRIIKAALLVNGHDPDIVQTITGFGDAGAALVKHSMIDKIIFTGSPHVGRLVMKGAVDNLTPIILELGGKDPMVICDDVKLDTVVPWAMRGCFQNCGQNCCGVERIFAYESIHDEFVDAITTKVKALRQGVPLKCCGSSGAIDCAAMVMDRQMDIIQEVVDDAVAQGAMLHCGGKRNASLKPGQFYEPTVLSGVTSNMRITKEEVFGPVMCIIRVPKNDDGECIRLVNDCKFRLGSCVYSSSQRRALAIGSMIRSGMCTVNDFGVNYLIQSLPFGGLKESGFGRFAGPEGLRACCLERAMVIDKVPSILRTTIPDPINYPIDVKKGIPFGTSLIQLFYSNSFVCKILAIIGLMKYG